MSSTILFVINSFLRHHSCILMKYSARMLFTTLWHCWKKTRWKHCDIKCWPHATEVMEWAISIPECVVYQEMFITAGFQHGAMYLRYTLRLRLLLTYLLLLEKLTAFAANQEIPCILWNPKVHYHTHKFHVVHSMYVATINTSSTICMVKVKVKVKFSLEEAMKAQRGSRCLALLFLWPRH